MQAEAENKVHFQIASFPSARLPSRQDQSQWNTTFIFLSNKPKEGTSKRWLQISIPFKFHAYNLKTSSPGEKGTLRSLSRLQVRSRTALEMPLGLPQKPPHWRALCSHSTLGLKQPREEQKKGDLLTGPFHCAPFPLLSRASADSDILTISGLQ